MLKTMPGFSVIMKHAGLFVNAVTQVMKLHLVSSVAFKEVSAKKMCYAIFQSHLSQVWNMFKRL